MKTFLKMAVLSLLFVVAAVGVAKQKKKHAEAAIIWNGNHIYDLCQHYKEEKLKGSLGPACFMYIAGVTQTLVLNDDTEMMKGPCPGKYVTDEQITAVVIKWMDDHPEKRDLPAPFIVMKSLDEAFPCN
jgi:Rap1a immunity proteins